MNKFKKNIEKTQFSLVMKGLNETTYAQEIILLKHKSLLSKQITLKKGKEKSFIISHEKQTNIPRKPCPFNK